MKRSPVIKLININMDEYHTGSFKSGKDVIKRHS